MLEQAEIKVGLKIIAIGIFSSIAGISMNSVKMHEIGEVKEILKKGGIRCLFGSTWRNIFPSEFGKLKAI